MNVASAAESCDMMPAELTSRGTGRFQQRIPWFGNISGLVVLELDAPLTNYTDLTTVTVPLEGEIEVSWFHPRTHPTQPERTSLTWRLFFCSHRAFQQTNGAIGGEVPRLEAISLRTPGTPKQQQPRHRLGNESWFS